MESSVEAYMADCMSAYEKKWLWQDTKYTFDLCGLGDGIRLNIALAWLRQGLDRLPAEKPLMEESHSADVKIPCNVRKEVCTLLSAFFDIIFGEGTGAALDCGTNAESFTAAYLDFMDFVQRQNQVLQSFRSYAERRYVEKAMALTRLTEPVA